MKVFISWSGEESRLVAQQLKDWLPYVLQGVQPYFTPSDIEKGAKWSTEIFAELTNSTFGIVVLTRDNLDKPWVIFEAGALSARLNAKACPLLVGVTPTELTGPLAQLNATIFQRDDFHRLIASVNSELADRRLDAQLLARSFEKWWPDLEQSIQKISAEVSNKPKPHRRETREMVEEILATVREVQRTQQTPPSGKSTLTTVSKNMARVFCEATLTMPDNISRDDILDRLDSISTNYRRLLTRVVGEDSSLGELLAQSARAIKAAKDEIPF